MAAAMDSRRTSAVAESMASRPYSDATWMTQSGTHPMGKGQILFTGPSGIRDYKVNVVTDDRMVGIGTMSQEGTSDLQYIWRGAPSAPPPEGDRSGWGRLAGSSPLIMIPRIPYQEIKYSSKYSEKHKKRNTLTGSKSHVSVTSFSIWGMWAADLYYLSEPLNKQQLVRTPVDEYIPTKKKKPERRSVKLWHRAPNDPDYKLDFPFTQGAKKNWRAPGQQRSKEQLPPRPHTSFHSNDRLPNLNNNAPSSRPVTVQSPSSESISRPASGQSAHSYTSAQFRSASVASQPHHTPPGSRPGSGGGHESSAYSSRSRGSQSSLRSRGSSHTSHPSRRRITPAATSVSSVYRAPTSDPDY